MLRAMHIMWLVAMLAMLCSSCHAQQPTTAQHLRVGAEVLASGGFAQLRGQRVGVVVNHTSLVNGTHLVDTLLASGIAVQRIFCPEHGLRGTAAAGQHVAGGIDSTTGITVVSLYGNSKKPTPQQMSDMDCMLFDLQDVGCRFYTYLSTLHYVMEACAEANVPLMVLDRPNPNGRYIDGPVLDTVHCRSFVGLHPVPVLYGMTIGEYAHMINGEQWLGGSAQCQLRVVAMHNYRRDSAYALPVPPSPNLRNAHAVALYPSLCLFEGTTCGVGRGTQWPFEVVSYGTDTLDLRSATAPQGFSLQYIVEMHSRVPHGKFFLRSNFFEKLSGSTTLRQQIESHTPEAEIRSAWQPQLEQFRHTREKYLIYK